MTDRPFILFIEYRSNGWDKPDRWAIGHWKRETDHFWFGAAIPYTWNRKREDRGWSRTMRRPLNLIVGRYPTQEEAEAAREAAVAVQRDIEARTQAVNDEMAKVMEPFLSRIRQLQAEEADTLKIITADGQSAVGGD